MANKIGLELKDYEGSKSTLCVGCGHNLINAALVEACYEENIAPHQTFKVSGIGCSSKSPAYIMKQAHGFNGLHGRMPSVAIGASLAASDLRCIGISGDGDTASIGLAQFIHALRTNPRMLYLVYNNGCYGLTKGQHSATADKGSYGRKAEPAVFEPIDLVGLALSMRAGFIARSFAGDKEQMLEIFKAALKYDGLAFIDIISPCITFNNNEGSTKSYWHAIENGKCKATHNPNDYKAAVDAWNKAKENDEILTGMVYIDAESQSLHSALRTTDKPLRELTEKDLCPGADALQNINNRFR